jgi:hypothetical protein
VTTLIAWAAIDNRETSAVYMASDSRISWGDSGVWDSGRKIFASEKFPEILGYTGDALFCTQVLGQVMAFVDSCEALAALADLDMKYDYVQDLVQRAFMSYPTNFCLPNFSVLYMTRVEKVWGACTFSWSTSDGWAPKQVHRIPLNWTEVQQGGQTIEEQTSAVLFVSDGSGGAKFRRFYKNSEWLTRLSLYSRGIFGAFVDFINSGQDAQTGGKPQIAGLYRKFEAKKIGFTQGEARFLYGIQLEPSDYGQNVRWVNATFENCDSESGMRTIDAQPQPIPFRRDM